MATNPRVQQWLQTPYSPEMGTGVDTQERIAKAVEYSAYHLFEISKKLDILISETSNLGGMVSDKD